MTLRLDKKYKLNKARICEKGFPCGASCISAKKVCLLENANYQDMLVLKGLMKEAIPQELRARHGERTGEQVVNLVVNETRALNDRLEKEENKLNRLIAEYEIRKDKYLAQNPDDKELKNWKANQRLLDNITRVQTGFNVLLNDLDELTKSIIELPQERRISLAETKIEPVGETVEGLLAEAYPIFSRFIDKSLSPTTSVTLLESNSGSFYRSGLDEIHIEPDEERESRTSIAHEYIHHLEKHNPELNAISRAFFESRTRNDKVIEHNGYPVKLDKFTSPYMGRLYATDARESLTVALEFMILAPYGFMRSDPEHFAFAYDALRGNFARLRKQYKEFLQ